MPVWTHRKLSMLQLTAGLSIVACTKIIVDCLRAQVWNSFASWHAGYRWSYFAIACHSRLCSLIGSCSFVGSCRLVGSCSLLEARAVCTSCFIWDSDWVAVMSIGAGPSVGFPYSSGFIAITPFASAWACKTSIIWNNKLLSRIYLSVLWQWCCIWCSMSYTLQFSGEQFVQKLMRWTNITRSRKKRKTRLRHSWTLFEAPDSQKWHTAPGLCFRPSPRERTIVNLSDW